MWMGRVACSGERGEVGGKVKEGEKGDMLLIPG